MAPVVVQLEVAKGRWGLDVREFIPELSGKLLRRRHDLATPAVQHYARETRRPRQSLTAPFPPSLRWILRRASQAPGYLYFQYLCSLYWKTGPFLDALKA